MKLTAIDYTHENSPRDFVESLHQTGFGVLVNHPIDQELVTDIYQEWQDFFLSEEKHELHFDSDTQAGFFPASVSETAKGHKEKDLKEFYHYYPWGPVPLKLKHNISTYYQQANALACELLQWVEQYSPKDVAHHYSIPLEKMIQSCDQTLLRILHYPPINGTEQNNAIRAAAHEDINLLTLLPAANEPGLQVQTKSGDWLDVPSDFGNLIINIGDMLQEASAGYFPSTTHRVLNPQGADMSKSRISLPLFLHPDPSVVLSEKYTAGAYLQERLKELGIL